MLNYLQGSTRPDISMAVHQCARFCNDPRLAHERAVMKIGKYLLATKDRGIKFTPDSSKGIECYADADFAGAWDKADANNPENPKVYRRAFSEKNLSNFTHDSMYGALCIISVQNVYF